MDGDHLCMVMADVSGKSIPAALFMMASKIILANNIILGKSPAQVLMDANAAICSHNQEKMFVTVWLGILELSTGKVTAANAGHEHPVLRHAGGGFEIINDPHGFVIGGMEGMLNALNTVKNESPKGVLYGVRRAVDDFVKVAEQFDDLTTLGVQGTSSEGRYEPVTAEQMHADAGRKNALGITGTEDE